jgi:hypothetical protein
MTIGGVGMVEAIARPIFMSHTPDGIVKPGILGILRG